ncbi:hypothetical protein BTN49_1225 [Candidatus Enterovibrio escicola]|uniref:Uncharacterized protein n=1 Tax=Candidatus Enterovibrio escicola TaxID=1927127 RepID=A0A2A5T4X3_9GAMM|nr:hypothetical protein BTN49_1225 [Candidatus Enterovibrio escacola]
MNRIWLAYPNVYTYFSHDFDTGLMQGAVEYLVTKEYWI